ncbi:hypothetical protein DICPUDRAFT_75654 [Dictyostelium purpureum]|uniref:Uncharacterized protein n=1 Tax=Dictyostelium purpureum TaxID=5786 RepID=F0ZBA1_DICPU|nr:uncharacterized protein DICPUDRAFT_75654 [Dictyostelium purpureum]EGC38807.1 hypothetical protein DICPUDRAFT_75654 [Dictyostelium purpureum]|eukprot:XP_003284701.1 hypothetical protein DICPUDRAFT_75654 [Dictyostelium purpureum]
MYSQQPPQQQQSHSIAVTPETPLINTQGDPIAHDIELEDSTKFLNHPIFYSVFLGCIAFIISAITSYVSIEYYAPSSSGYTVISAFSILPCILAPFIIHKITQKITLILCLLLLVISFFINQYSNNGVLIFGRFLVSFSTELSAICILSVLVLVNWDTKRINQLFCLYYLVSYALQISNSYITDIYYKVVSSNFLIAFILVAIIYAAVLAQPKRDSINNKLNPLHTIHHRYFAEKENNFALLLPLLLFFGFGYILFVPFYAAVAVIPITILLERYGRLRVFQILMGIALISVVTAFILAYTYNIVFVDGFVYGYTSGAYKGFYYMCTISFSIFTAGTLLILNSMVSTGSVFDKEKIVAVLSAFKGAQALGTFLYSICIFYISPWVGWYLFVILYVVGCVLFMIFLKVKGQHCC